MKTYPDPPRPGQVVVLDRAASVQFDGDRGLTVQILEVDQRPTLEGWAWLTVAVLGPPAARRRAAVRTVFVRPAGLRPATIPEELLGMPRGRRVPAAERAEAVPQLIR
jgi:hypothetical protein